MNSGIVRVNSVRFNQDSSRFACGLDNGFVLFNSNPLKQILHVDLDESVDLVESLFRCNIVALKPTFDPNKVIIFDCSLHKTVIKLDVRQPVKNVLLRRDRIIVARESCTAVYSLNDIPEHILSVETAQNPLGLCSTSHTDSSVLAFPSKSIGHVGILSLTHPQRRLKILRAHNHSLQAIALNLNGSLIATAGVKGTVIRLYDVQTTNLVREFRRGGLNATISCIKFSTDWSTVCVASNHKTIHVFNVKEKAEQNQSLLQRYFNNRPTSIRLYTQTPDEPSKNSNTQCAFVGNGCSVAVIDLNTHFYKFDVDVDRLSCLQWTHKLFMSEDGKVTD